MSETHYLGVDLGGTRIKAAVAGGDGRIAAEERAPTESQEGPDSVIARIAALARLTGEKAGVEVESMGIGLPGTLDIPNGVTLYMPNFPTHWQNVPVRDKLEKLLDWPVYLLNDVRTATLGELDFGCGKSAPTLIFMALGTGVGGGVVIDGRLRLGKLGSAGELGHIVVQPYGGLPCGCGGQGCLETVASGPALCGEGVRLLLSGLAPKLFDIVEGNPAGVTAETMGEAARAGDQRVLMAIERMGHFLGLAVTDLVVAIHPELVVIGGGVAGLGDMLFNAIRKTLRKKVGIFSTDDIRIEPSALGDRAGVLGAVALAKRGGLLDQF
ncbi:MAG TPA: ROK family protein [Sumerlaeia bacterium]|nr:ROK family protein [Sumerlaeia bacterium]